jgi:hypothetical protein
VGRLPRRSPNQLPEVTGIALIATALDPFCHAAFVNDRHPAIAVAPNNDIIALACVVVPIIAVMVSYSDAYAGRTDADIRLLCMRRKHDRNSDGRK